MLNIYDGTSWKTVDAPLVWTGTEWRHYTPEYFDGEQWAPQAILTSGYAAGYTVRWDVAEPTTPPAPPVQTYTVTKSFAATWAASYRSSGVKRTDTSDLYQGYYGSTNGNQKSLVGFGVTGIPAGATLISATVTLYANHWYYNSGGTAIIGHHAYSSAPASSPSFTSNVQQYVWNTKTGSRTITLSSTIGNGLLNGTIKGLAFGPGPTTAYTYYGNFAGTGGYRPVITLKYSYTA